MHGLWIWHPALGLVGHHHRVIALIYDVIIQLQDAPLRSLDKHMQTMLFSLMYPYIVASQCKFD